MFEASLWVLRDLDEEGLFGAGTAREKLVLSIRMGDRSDEGRTEQVKCSHPRWGWERSACDCR